MAIKILFIFIIALTITSCNMSDFKTLSSNLKNNTNSSNSFTINIQPIAKITTKKENYKEDEEVILDGSTSIDEDGSIVSYKWYEAKKVIGDGKLLKIKLPANLHLITLVVKDNNGAISKTIKNIQVMKNYKKLSLNIENIQKIKTLRAPTKELRKIYISNNMLYASCDDGKVYQWELRIGKVDKAKDFYANKNFQISAFDANNNFIFTGSNDNSLKIWDKKSYTLQKKFNEHSSEITDIKHFNNYLITSSFDKKINIYNVQKDDMYFIKSLSLHKSPITQLSIVKNYLISYSTDGVIKMWNIDNGFSLENSINVEYGKVNFLKTVNMNIITVMKNGEILLWDIFKGAVLNNINIDNQIIDISINKKYVYLALSNNTIIRFNANNPSEKTTILKLNKKISKIDVAEGVVAIGYEDLDIDIYSNREEFIQR